MSDTGNESPAYIRNPSPPPELTQNAELFEADSIGNTSYSKHWLFSTLMKLIEEVERESKTTEDTEFGVDVDEELQNELCKLWDMSMNFDVAKFLHDFKATQILTGVIGRSKAPRVTEICVGILGNMSCDREICVQISKEQKLIDLVLLLLENRDPPTLVETTRLLYTSLSNPDARSPWISAVINSHEVFDHLKFIFQSSTNCDLLKNAAEFVDVLLDQEDTLCTAWATDDFIHALLEAIKQIGCGHSDTLEVYFHLFQLLSTSETGIEALVSCSEELEKPLMKYLNLICEDEIVGLEGRGQCVAPALCVLNVLFASNDNIASMLTKDESMMRIFLKILEPLVPWLNLLNSSVTKDKTNDENDKCEDSIKISDTSESNRDIQSACTNGTTDKRVQPTSANGTKVSETRPAESNASTSGECLTENRASYRLGGQIKNSSDSDLPQSQTDSDEKVRKMLTIIYSIIKGFLYDYMFSLYVISTEETQNHKDYIKILTYLNDSSSRSRINYLVLTLKETVTSDFDACQFLLDVSEKYHQERLCRIIKDVKDGKHLNRSDSDPDRYKS